MGLPSDCFSLEVLSFVRRLALWKGGECQERFPSFFIVYCVNLSNRIWALISRPKRKNSAFYLDLNVKRN